MQITQRFAFEMMYRQYCCVITAYQFEIYLQNLWNVTFLGII